MSEIETEVKTYKIEYECDTCNSGNMKPTGRMLCSSPPQYPHVCGNCGHEENFTDKQYPIIITR